MSVKPALGAAEDIGGIATGLRVHRRMLAFLLVGFGSVLAISTRMLLLGRLTTTD